MTAFQTEYVFIFAIAVALWFWWSSAKSREIAVAYARTACKRCNVQLLDETVTLCKIRLRRSPQGHMAVARWYQFEFSTDGNDRRSGLVGIHGSTLSDMHLDLNIDELQH